MVNVCTEFSFDCAEWCDDDEDEMVLTKQGKCEPHNSCDETKFQQMNNINNGTTNTTNKHISNAHANIAVHSIYYSTHFAY